MISTDYITHEEIRRRAHEIWHEKGRPAGADEAHWHAAERELQQEREAHDEPSPSPRKE
ncbi:MAG: DUF2934 domain-containing protein [Verrucomicrobiota bacterium]